MSAGEFTDVRKSRTGPVEHVRADVERRYRERVGMERELREAGWRPTGSGWWHTAHGERSLLDAVGVVRDERGF